MTRNVCRDFQVEWRGVFCLAQPIGGLLVCTFIRVHKHLYLTLTFSTSAPVMYLTAEFCSVYSSCSFMQSLLTTLQSDWSRKSYFSYDSPRCITNLFAAMIEVSNTLFIGVINYRLFLCLSRFRFVWLVLRPSTFLSHFEISNIKSICRRLEAASDVISGLDVAWTRANSTVKFGDYDPYSLCRSLKFQMDGQTDTVLVTIVETPYSVPPTNGFQRAKLF